MKSRNLILAAMLLAMSSTMMAQQNIKKAFDALLNEKITDNRASHVLDRDPETGRMTAMADVYDFTISSKSALERLDDVRKAFEKDKKDAYSINSGIREKGGEDTEVEPFSSLFESLGFPSVSLSVGDGKHPSVSIGTMKGSDYIYACFADKDDPDHRYRYAYALEWVEKSKKTHVRLAVTYALRPEARDNSKDKKKSKINRIIVNGKDVSVDKPSGMLDNIFSSVLNYSTDSLLFNREKTPESWLSEFNNYKRLFLKNPDGATATHYATSIYSLCKKSAMLEPEEKKLVINELTKLKAAAKDELIQNIFEMSIKKLK
ncbi:MAG: hypothetical protein E7101_13415 [Prevotella ruminicola]|jgi:hypothetical protein|uniref:HEAT repeat domain-containing protein n=1 Tax=Xylanibacter ruminicola TaxID=839 RepID=A0A9D5SCL5_XYLRU|nr:hypothetical protein [Xylanibacter ruminicola]